MKKKPVLILLLIGAVFSLLGFNPGLAGFNVKVDGVKIHFNRFIVFVLPGDTIRINAEGKKSDQLVIQYSEGHLIEKMRFHWEYVAPSTKGNHELIVLHNNQPEKMVLNIFVMVPASEQKGEYLNSYHIGKYPEKLYRNNPAYEKPRGFIEVTQANEDLLISPHFRLKQFICKQQPGHWPKYMVLNPKLLIKLELLLEELNKKGIPVNTLFIMSGYRSPYYNASIGRGIYSRHIYGDAADIYVDTNHDNVIDDLNRDGKADMADAVVMRDIIDSLDKNPKYHYLIGGLGKYKKTSAHTWDIHVDTRGFKARW
ncbi:MAG TPA: hypothetical protein ENH02_07480 [Bacteroidetes bacterium]|nr:hypothetical protein [Bacteroidota bacterium]